MKHLGFSFPFFLRRARLASLGMVGACLLTSCQMAPQGVSLAPTPSTLIYSYLIANGMARGHIMAERMSDAQLIALAAADHTALLSILVAARQPSRHNFDRANEAMVLYLGTIDGDAVQPAPARGAVGK